MLIVLTGLAHLKVFSQLWVEISRADSLGYCARVNECTCTVSAWGSLFVFLQQDSALYLTQGSIDTGL